MKSLIRQIPRSLESMSPSKIADCVVSMCRLEVFPETKLRRKLGRKLYETFVNMIEIEELSPLKLSEVINALAVLRLSQFKMLFYRVERHLQEDPKKFHLEYLVSILKDLRLLHHEVKKISIRENEIETLSPSSLIFP